MPPTVSPELASQSGALPEVAQKSTSQAFAKGLPKTDFQGNTDLHG